MSTLEHVLFLTMEEVLEIHEDQITNYGGSLGIRDQGLLESALAQPQASFSGEYLHKDIFEIAAAYGYHLVENHPFTDGNKRLGIVSALVFLDLNGIEIEVENDILERFTLDLAAGKVAKEQLAEFFRSHSQGN